jgi:hypothetical protein
MMKIWLAIASVGLTALCALEAVLWLKDRRENQVEKLFDDFSEGLRGKRKSNA